MYICRYHEEWESDWKELKDYVKKNFDELRLGSDCVNADLLPTDLVRVLALASEIVIFNPDDNQGW